MILCCLAAPKVASLKHSTVQKMCLRSWLSCHDPFSNKTSADKATFGRVDAGFVFLGYDIRPGLFQPSAKARQKLEETIDSHIYFGRQAILDVKKAGNSSESRQRYAQTQVLIDKVLRGWGNSFSYSNAPATIEDLDCRIDAKLNKFRSWFSEQLRDQDWKTKRRLGGVCLLSDLAAKSLDDVPFILDRGMRFVRSTNTVTISTDGLIAPRSKEG